MRLDEAAGKLVDVRGEAGTLVGGHTDCTPAVELVGRTVWPKKRAPNGGRTDHDVMRRVAGRSEDAPGDKTEERIPGERDAETAMHSEPGIIAGTGYGENIPTGQPDTMDERTHRERKREGGGDPGQRDKSKGGLHG